MARKPFVSSLAAVLAVTVMSAGAGAQTATPPSGSSAAPPPAAAPPGPPGSVPIEPERRETEPRQSEPSPRPPPRAGKVEFIPSDPSVSLLTESGVTPVGYGVYDYDWWGYPRRHYVYGGYAPVFTPMCTGHCTVSMEPGTYELALEKNGRIARLPPTYVPGSAKLNGTYVDRSGTRAAGLAIGIAGGVGGVVMMIASYRSHLDCDLNGVCFQHDWVQNGLFAAGLGTLIGSVIVGTILASVHDRAEITVTPLRLSSTPGFMSVAFDRAVTDGAALSVRF